MIIPLNTQFVENAEKKIMTHNSSVVCFYTRQTKRQTTNQMLLVLLDGNSLVL